MPEPLRRKLVGYAGLFDDPNRLVEAAAKVRDAGWKQWDCHTPYPVHGLDRAMGLRPSPIPYICLAGGFAGAALAMWTQWWMSAVDYPVRIGGKPLFSWPAFTPIILSACLTATPPPYRQKMRDSFCTWRWRRRAASRSPAWMAFKTACHTSG